MTGHWHNMMLQASTAFGFKLLDPKARRQAGWTIELSISNSHKNMITNDFRDDAIILLVKRVAVLDSAGMEDVKPPASPVPIPQSIGVGLQGRVEVIFLVQQLHFTYGETEAKEANLGDWLVNLD